MELLCIMAENTPKGYLTIGGKPIEITTLCRMTGGTESEVENLLNELEHNGVFSRDKAGKIYSRRIVKDENRGRISRENGKNGGNPNLRKQRDISSQVNPQDKGGVKPQILEARKKEESLVLQELRARDQRPEPEKGKKSHHRKTMEAAAKGIANLERGNAP